MSAEPRLHAALVSAAKVMSCIQCSLVHYAVVQTTFFCITVQKYKCDAPFVPRCVHVVPGAAAIRRRRQPLSFKPQSAVKLVASRLSNNAVPISFTDLKTLIPVPRPVLLRCRLTVLKLN